MDWGSAVIAGIASGIGAGAGSGIAALIPIQKAKKYITIVFAVLGLFLGNQFLKPQIELQFGQSIRDVLGQKDVIEELRQQPLFARVFDDDPELESIMRERLVQAKAQGNVALLREVQKIGVEIGQSKAPEYFVLAREEDLLAAITSISDVIVILADNNPMLCTAWLFGGQNGQTYEFSEFQNLIGKEKINHMNVSLARVVENSFNEIPSYDTQKAQALVEQAAMGMVAVAGPEGLPVIAEAVVPSTEEIARSACQGVGELYSQLLDNETHESANALRHLFASS